VRRAPIKECAMKLLVKRRFQDFIENNIETRPRILRLILVDADAAC
jgi:hypothetical protein